MITRDQIRTDHNHERMAERLGKLETDAGLNTSAQRVARRLARADAGIAHAPRWWKVINKMTRMRYRAIGENLASGFDSPGALMGAWLRSPLHRKNILSRKFKRIGIGIATSHSGETYICVHFGG